MRLINAALPAIVVAAAAIVPSACRTTNEAQTTVLPVTDSVSLEQAYRDSVARAEAEARAAAAAAELAAQRHSDSLEEMRRTNLQLRSLLTTMIHFDYDRSMVRPGDGQVLDLKIPVLLANPEAQVLVEGHCDERGSDEYNIALGNRRAIAAKAYLVTHGVPAERIETISYGEERPVDPSRNATAWAMNRNAQFKLLPPDVALRNP